MRIGLYRHAVAVVFLSGLLAVPVKAALYVGPGAVVLDQVRVPYGYPNTFVGPGLYPYSYGRIYPYGPWHVFPSVPPPSRYVVPSVPYRVNPYLQPPYSFSYEIPPHIYAPDTFTYDLRAYGYGYLPGLYPPPGLYYYRYSPRWQRPTPYRPMSLLEYKVRQLRGPVRVRDIVPGAGELGG